MWIKFTQGYRGVLTDEKYYPPGALVNVNKETGTKLIAEKRAVLYKKKKEAEGAGSNAA